MLLPRRFNTIDWKGHNLREVLEGTEIVQAVYTLRSGDGTPSSGGRLVKCGLV